MGTISVNTQAGVLNFSIKGDQPSPTELLRINKIINTEVPKMGLSNLRKSPTELNEEKTFDTTTGIKDAKLRAALSVVDKNTEKDKVLAEFGFLPEDYIRDSRGQLALTPSGAKKTGLETDKNVLIDESGFSRYDFADLAGIVPEVGGAVTGAIKGAGVGTAIAPGFGTLFGSAIGAFTGAFGGSLIEEGIEKSYKVSDQSREEILKQATREGLWAGGAELLFGAPFLIFKGLQPRAGILKEGTDSRAVQDAALAVQRRYEPSTSAMGMNPMVQKVESMQEAVYGASKRTVNNANQMKKDVGEFNKIRAELMKKTGAQNYGDLLKELDAKSLKRYMAAEKKAREAVDVAIKDSADILNRSLAGNARIDDDLYKQLSDNILEFDRLATEKWKNIDAVLKSKSGLGTANVIPAGAISEISENIVASLGRPISALGDSAKDKAYKFLIRELAPGLQKNGKISFSQAYNARKQIMSAIRGDTRFLGDDIVKAVRNDANLFGHYKSAMDEFDKLLSKNNILQYSDDITKAVGDDGFNAIIRAAKDWPGAKKWYQSGMNAFDDIADAMGSKEIVKIIRENNRLGIPNARPENLEGFALSVIKNNKISTLKNLERAFGYTKQGKAQYADLKNQIGNIWVKAKLENSGMGRINPNVFSPEQFLKDVKDLGKTGNELFGSAGYKSLLAKAEELNNLKTSKIDINLLKQIKYARPGKPIEKSIVEALDEAVQIGKEVGELQSNKILRQIRQLGPKPSADEAVNVISANGVALNDLKVIMDYFRKNDPSGLATIQKHYLDTMFDGVGATVNKDTLLDVAKAIDKADGTFSNMPGVSGKKLNVIFAGDEFATKGADGKVIKTFSENLREFSRIMKFIAKDTPNSNLVASNMTANVLNNLGKIARIGILGNLVSNRRALEQLSRVNGATKNLPDSQRRIILAQAVSSMFKQSSSQTANESVKEGERQLKSAIKNSKISSELSNIRSQANQSQNMFNITQQPGPQPQLPQNITTQPNLTSGENEFQRYNANIRQRAAQNPAVAASLLGGLGSAGLLKS
tara:strand:+ start:2 stop:3133 length:3132 start_codon:yes stop_codon:yes gene_type:complete